MERLTKKCGNNSAVPTKFSIDFILDLSDEDWFGLQAIFEKLAYYEDLEEQGVYRKQIAKEIFNDIEKLKFTEYDWHDRIEWDGIAELKKKYMI